MENVLIHRSIFLFSGGGYADAEDKIYVFQKDVGEEVYVLACAGRLTRFVQQSVSVGRSSRRVFDQFENVLAPSSTEAVYCFPYS